MSSVSLFPCLKCLKSGIFWLGKHLFRQFQATLPSCATGCCSYFHTILHHNVFAQSVSFRLRRNRWTLCIWPFKRNVFSCVFVHTDQLSNCCLLVSRAFLAMPLNNADLQYFQLDSVCRKMPIQSCGLTGTRWHCGSEFGASTPQGSLRCFEIAVWWRRSFNHL